MSKTMKLFHSLFHSRLRPLDIRVKYFTTALLVISWLELDQLCSNTKCTEEHFGSRRVAVTKAISQSFHAHAACLC